MPETISIVVNPEFGPWLAAKVEYVMDASGDVYANEVRSRMERSPASGRLYRSRRKGGGLHRASAPGEAPAVDTGTLIQSIAAVSSGAGFRRVVEIGVTSAESAKYAVPLEVGTARILPRPAWIPALGAVRGRLGSPE